MLGDRIRIHFSDRDMAAIEVTANDRTIRTFGAVQVWQANSRIEQHRFRDKDGSTIALRVAPGVYEIRLQVLDKKFVLGHQRFDRGATLRYSDADLPSPEFFSDKEFIEVAAGAFTRGSTEFKNASPPHEISLSAFRIPSIPVTACEYASYLAAGKYAQVDDVEACSGQEALKPAVYVGWDDAKRFCTWLSDFKKQSFRLPTEAEYERAMRIARLGSKYPWGDSEYDPEKPRVPLANYREYWRGGARPDRTPVRLFPSTRGCSTIFPATCGNGHRTGMTRSSIAGQKPNCGTVGDRQNRPCTKLWSGVAHSKILSTSCHVHSGGALIQRLDTTMSGFAW